MYQTDHVIIDYGINPFDICIKQPTIWKFCKFWFVFTYVFASFFISNLFINLLYKHFKDSNKNINKKTKIKKSKNKRKIYSLIDPKPQNEKLELLIR